MRQPAATKRSASGPASSSSGLRRSGTIEAEATGTVSRPPGTSAPLVVLQPGLADSDAELVGIGRHARRVAHRHQAVLDEREQALVERLHAVVLALADDRL